MIIGLPGTQVLLSITHRAPGLQSSPLCYSQAPTSRRVRTAAGDFLRAVHGVNDLLTIHAI